MTESLPAGIRTDRTHERVLLYADDLEALKVTADELDGGAYHLRQANLEDLFLKATGRALNDAQ